MIDRSVDRSPVDRPTDRSIDLGQVPCPPAECPIRVTMGSQARLFYSTRTPKTRALSAALGAHRYKGPATKIGKGFGTLSGGSWGRLGTQKPLFYSTRTPQTRALSAALAAHRYFVLERTEPNQKIGKGFGMPLGFVKFCAPDTSGLPLGRQSRGLRAL